MAQQSKAVSGEPRRDWVGMQHAKCFLSALRVGTVPIAAQDRVVLHCRLGPQSGSEYEIVPPTMVASLPTSNVGTFLRYSLAWMEAACRATVRRVNWAGFFIVD